MRFSAMAIGKQVGISSTRKRGVPLTSNSIVFGKIRLTLGLETANCGIRAAEVVASSLLHFDGDRYVMGDFVIMPNHVHCLVAFRDADRMRKQCGEWMRFTARRINSLFGRSGELWYEEPFDHLVRSEDQLNYLRQYIADNPIKAKLKAGQFLYRKSNWHF